MTKRKLTPDEERILRMATDKDGNIEGTVDLILDQARMLGLLPEVDEEDNPILEPDESTIPISEQVEQASRDIFPPDITGV